MASTSLHSWKQENISRELTQRLVICRNTNDAFLGNNRQNALLFCKFDLQQIFIYRNRMPVADSPISTNDDKRPHLSAISDLAYLDKGPGFDRVIKSIYFGF